jgi:hypothetical protein
MLPCMFVCVFALLIYMHECVSWLFKDGNSLAHPQLIYFTCIHLHILMHVYIQHLDLVIEAVWKSNEWSPSEKERARKEREMQLYMMLDRAYAVG